MTLTAWTICSCKLCTKVRCMDATQHSKRTPNWVDCKKAVTAHCINECIIRFLFDRFPNHSNVRLRIHQCQVTGSAQLQYYYYGNYYSIISVHKCNHQVMRSQLFVFFTRRAMHLNALQRSFWWLSWCTGLDRKYYHFPITITFTKYVCT